MKGLTDQLRVIGDLIGFGVDPERILPVLNRSGRTGRSRSDTASAFGDLVSPITTSLPSPLHLPERRRLEEAVRDNMPLPSQLTEPLASAVTAALDAQTEAPTVAGDAEPVAVLPGSLGHFTDPEDLDLGEAGIG